MAWSEAPCQKSTNVPSFMAVVAIVSEKMSMFKFLGPDGQTDAGTSGRQTSEGHYIDSLC